jgi:predicted RNA binding protein YcfA (HicA-like mRNA interferase family)
MKAPRKILEKAKGSAVALRFTEATGLAESLGFRLSRVLGSHHIYTHPEVPELLNLQEVRGMAKPHQVRQLLRLMERYNLKVRVS